MSEVLELSPDVLEWAASQTGASLAELATRISKRAHKRIVDGSLTTAQAVKFAHEAGVPFGYLFLSEPPEERKRPPLTDFRTLINPAPLSRDFFDVYEDVEFKQAWYRDFLEREHSEPLSIVGRFQGRAAAPTEVVARDIRQTLKFDGSSLAGARTAEEAYSILAEKVESIGILVFKNGIVGNNTRRALSVHEFRGFAISDPLAPIIFVNGADAPAAWLFTLAHELAHIWLGESGISDASPSSINSSEARCNAIAAEVLVPKKEFFAFWEAASGDLVSKIDGARRRFKVSALVIGRRAIELGLAPMSIYESLYNQARKAKNEDTSSGGGNFYATLGVRNSKRFSSRVASLATSGGISLREAGQLLNTNPNNVVVFYGKQRALST